MKIDHSFRVRNIARIHQVCECFRRGTRRPTPHVFPNLSIQNQSADARPACRLFSDLPDNKNRKLLS
ncbi:hypothetical protein HZA43_05245 [Candidatus Peregrinibacteria bacterium]|nr:hypothetical protein [Candidatus Peregrinibacteria bacterium]